MEEDNKPIEGQEPETTEIEIPEDVYNTIKSQIETSFTEQLTSKDKEIEELKQKLQVANKNKTIIISNKAQSQEPKQEPKKKLDIFI